MAAGPQRRGVDLCRQTRHDLMTDDPLNPPPPFGIPVARPVQSVALGRSMAPPTTVAPGAHPMHLATVRAATVWQDLGIFLLAAAASMALVGVAAGFVLVLVDELDERLLTAVFLPIQAALLTALVAGLLKARSQTIRSVGLTSHQLWVDVSLGVPAAGAAFAVFGLGNILLSLLWPEAWEALRKNDTTIMKMLPPMPLWAMTGLMAVVGFYEELVFRGFLLTRLRRVSSSWIVAVAVSSALFAAPHAHDQETITIIPLFGLGVIFAVLTIWRKSLVPAMVGHAVFNAGVLTLMRYQYPEWS